MKACVEQVDMALTDGIRSCLCSDVRSLFEDGHRASPGNDAMFDTILHRGRPFGSLHVDAQFTSLRGAAAAAEGSLSGCLGFGF